MKAFNLYISGTCILDIFMFSIADSYSQFLFFILILAIFFFGIHVLADTLDKYELPPELASFHGSAKTALYAFGYVTIFLLISSYFSIDLTAVFVTLGGSSLVIAYAAKDIIENFLAGIILILTQPFKVGDTVNVSQAEGVVQNISLRYVLLEKDGKRFLVPNGIMLKAVILVTRAHKKLTPPKAKTAKKTS